MNTAKVFSNIAAAAGVPQLNWSHNGEELLDQVRKTAESNGLLSHDTFEECLALIAHVRTHKVIAYGEERYNVSNARYDLSMCHADLERKMLRLKNLVYSDKPINENAGDTINDTALDIAAYGIMLLQIVVSLNRMEML